MGLGPIRYIDAIGHDWGGEWVQTTLPTCTQAGVKTQACLRNSQHINFEKQAGDPALGHDWGEYAQTAEPTCTQAGIMKRSCLRDPSHIDPQTQAGEAALGHDWDEWVQTEYPTFIAAGIRTRKCLRIASHIDPQTQAGDPPRLIMSTSDWNMMKNQISGKTGNYTITISGDVGIEGGSATFGTTPDGKTLQVTLKGNGKLYLTKASTLLYAGNNQTLIIDSEDLRLEGYRNTNTEGPIISVAQKGKAELKNGVIAGNQDYQTVTVFGAFTMSGGQIDGGKHGVYVQDNGLHPIRITQLSDFL